MKTVLKDAFTLITGEIIAKGLGFVATAFLARRLGVEAFGKLGFAVAIYTYFALLVSNGTETIGMREVARNERPLFQIVSSIFFLRSCYVLVAFSTLAIASVFVNANPSTVLLLWLQVLNLLLFPWALQYVSQGLRLTQYVALIKVIQSMIYLLLIVLFVQTFQDIYAVPIVLLLATFTGQVILMMSYQKRFGVLFRKVPLSSLKELFRISLPVGAAGIFIAISSNIDVVILGLSKTDIEVGQYSAAYKIIFLVIGFQTILAQVSLVLFSKLWSIGRDTISTLVNRVLPLILGGSVFISLILVSFSEAICHTLYGSSYADSAALLTILSFVIPLIFSGSLLGQVLLSSDQQARYLTCVGIGGILNLAANVVVIPTFGAHGAAYVTLGSELVVLSMLLFRSRGSIRFNWRRLTHECGIVAIMTVLVMLPLPASFRVAAMLTLGLYVLILLRQLRGVASEIGL